MKIRNGYVSNSSSSSFLVTFKDLNTFNKFREFEGYSTFISDINNEKNNNIESLITCFIQNEMNTLIERFEYEARGWDWDFNESYNRNGQWYYLKDFFNYKEDETSKCCEKIVKLGNKFVDKMRGREYNYQDKDVLDFEKNVYKIMDKSVDIAKKFLASDNVKGWNFKNIEYADETNDGSFMENQFMPFIMNCPEKDIIILGQSNH